MSLMGIDIGTSSCKVLIISENGDILAQTSELYSLHTNTDGHVELNPFEVREKVFSCIRRCNAFFTPEAVTAFSISSQGEAIIPVNSQFEPLTFAPVSADLRGLPYVGQLRERFGDRYIRQITGQLLDPIHSIFKIMWWNEHERSIQDKCWKYCCFDAYILLSLGMPPITDTSMASRTMLYDITKRDWSSELLSFASVERSALPEVVCSGTLVGTLPEKISESLGFSTPPDVVVGGHDQPCAAFGNGLVDSGVSYSIGTTECISVIRKGAHICNSAWDFPTYPHLFSGTTVTLIGSQTGTRIFRWLGTVLFDESSQEFDENMELFYDLIRTVSKDLTTPVLFLPHLFGGSSLYEDPYAKAMIYGFSQDTGRRKFLKAVMEGITFEQYLGYQKFLGQISNDEINDSVIVATGGGARLQNFLSIKSDVFGKVFTTKQSHEAGCIGAAMLAGLGNGCFTTPHEAIELCVVNAQQVYPDDTLKLYYQEKVKQYDILYQALKTLHLQGESHATK
ncbi:MAG: FGGY family carbohydrate kinase [Sphaerochaetaceae bacterium]